MRHRRARRRRLKRIGRSGRDQPRSTAVRKSGAVSGSDRQRQRRSTPTRSRTAIRDLEFGVGIDQQAPDLDQPPAPERHQQRDCRAIGRHWSRAPRTADRRPRKIHPRTRPIRATASRRTTISIHRPGTTRRSQTAAARSGPAPALSATTRLETCIQGRPRRIGISVVSGGGSLPSGQTYATTASRRCAYSSSTPANWPTRGWHLAPRRAGC